MRFQKELSNLWYMIIFFKMIRQTTYHESMARNSDRRVVCNSILWECHYTSSHKHTPIDAFFFLLLPEGCWPKLIHPFREICDGVIFLRNNARRLRSWNNSKVHLAERISIFEPNESESRRIVFDHILNIIDDSHLLAPSDWSALKNFSSFTSDRMNRVG